MKNQKKNVPLNIETAAMCSGRELPAKAYEGYLNQGRGAMVIRLSDIRELSRSPGFYSFPWKYGPAGSDLLKQIGLWPDTRMAKILEDYDPESEVILVIIAPDGIAHCLSRQMHDELLPPRAFQAWRRENPIGLRLNPERQPGRHLKDLARLARDQQHAQRLDRKMILSSPEHQAGFLNSLIDSQQKLSEEIRRKGYQVGGSEGIVYEPGDESATPRFAWDRLQEFALLVDYMVVTTALNQVLLEYEARKGEDCLHKAACVGLDALDDKYLVLLASLTTLDCEEEMRECFIYMTAALLATRIDFNRNPRLRAALACDGGDPGEELLLRLSQCIPLAWEEYANKAHVSSENDSNVFVNLVVKELERDEPEACHQARIRAQQLRRESSRKVEAIGTPDFDNATARIAKQLFEDQLSLRESVVDVRNLVNKTQLTEREHEVLNHQLEGESNVEIAGIMDTAASTIRTHVSSITKKLRTTAERGQKPHRAKSNLQEETIQMKATIHRV